MGLFSKQDEGKPEPSTEFAVEDARKAASEGRRRVVLKLGSEGSPKHGESLIESWSSAIEQVEAQGWRLTHFSVHKPDKDRFQMWPYAYGVFERA